MTEMLFSKRMKIHIFLKELKIIMRHLKVNRNIWMKGLNMRNLNLIAFKIQIHNNTLMGDIHKQ